MLRNRLLNVDTATMLLSIYLGLLFLAYCLIFLWACPSATLAFAVLVEVGVFCLSLLLLWKNPFALSFAFSRYFARLTNIPGLSLIIKSYRYVRLSILSFVVIIASFDFVAFSTAAFCNSPLTARLYCFVPTSQLLGLRPAATLESLAGAFVEKEDYVKAESLYQSILEIRKHVAGPDSDLVAALYADFGDLNIRKEDLKSAERWYRKSISLAPSSGRALTGLATTLREEGCLLESKSYYLRALASRSRSFGTKSKQYQDTLHGYQKLMTLKMATMATKDKDIEQ